MLQDGGLINKLLYLHLWKRYYNKAILTTHFEPGITSIKMKAIYFPIFQLLHVIKHNCQLCAKIWSHLFLLTPPYRRSFAM